MADGVRLKTENMSREGREIRNTGEISNEELNCPGNNLRMSKNEYLNLIRDGNLTRSQAKS